jgi:hypothetical protein
MVRKIVKPKPTPKPAVPVVTTNRLHPPTPFRRKPSSASAAGLQPLAPSVVARMSMSQLSAVTATMADIEVAAMVVDAKKAQAPRQRGNGMAGQTKQQKEAHEAKRMEAITATAKLVTEHLHTNTCDAATKPRSPAPAGHDLLDPTALANAITRAAGSDTEDDADDAMVHVADLVDAPDIAAAEPCTSEPVDATSLQDVIASTSIDLTITTSPIKVTTSQVRLSPDRKCKAEYIEQLKDVQGARTRPFTQSEFVRLLLVMHHPYAVEAIRKLRMGLSKSELDARKSSNYVDPWELLLSIFNDPTTIFDQACLQSIGIGGFNPNHFHQRNSDMLKTKWSQMRSKYSIIQARKDKSGAGSDKPFSAYLRQADWHPKVMIIIDKFTTQSSDFMDFAYRSADPALKAADPAQKKQKTTHGGTIIFEKKMLKF